MKNMKKLLQKAMVFTLAAAMLVGTPLAASATGLADLYRTENGGVSTTDNSRTATTTVTNTDTNTNTNPLPDEAKILGIKLDHANVRLMSGRTQRLTATLDWGDVTPSDADKELADALLDKLEWESSDEKVVTFRKVNSRLGQKTVILTAKTSGEAVITVSLDDDTHNIHHKAETKVSVFQYADVLKFDNEKIKDDAYTGNSLVLDEYVKRYIKVGGVEEEVEDTADTLTFTLVDDGGKRATLKNGVLKLNKPTEKDKPVKVVASGKIAKSDVGIVNITAGINATKLTFEGVGVKGSKLTWLVNDGLTTDVTVKVAGKKSVDASKKSDFCTDTITWSSANSDIVEIKEVKGGDQSNGQGELGSTSVKADEDVKFAKDQCTVSLDFTNKKAGKTQIIGKVSSGKTFKLNVTVSADLTSVVLDKDITAYTGQIIDLNDKIAVKRFGDTVTSDNFEAEGLVKWEFVDKKNMSKLAKLNAKTGILEIKPDLKKENRDDLKQIAVRAVAAKKGKNIKPFAPVEEGENETKLTLKQVNITEISITKVEDVEKPWNVQIKAGESQLPRNMTDSIDVGKTVEYVLDAKGEIEGVSADDLSMALGWTASGNGKTIKATKEGNLGYLTALKKGSATITASGVTMKGEKYVPIKVTFKDTVNAPSEHITLSVKNKDITAKYKKGKIADQKITIKAILDKGTTTKNKASGTDLIEWTATLDKVNGDSEDITSQMNFGKLTLSGYNVGDKVTVNATVKNTGASDTITMTVVEPTKKVVFKKYIAEGALEESPIGNAVIDIPEIGIDVCAYIESSDSEKSGIADGINRAGVVSYTVSGKGAVFVKVQKDGRISIEPLKEGSVTIKFVMTDGKKGTLKGKVTKTPGWIENVMEMTSFINNMFR